MKTEIKVRAWDGKEMLYDFSKEKNLMGIILGFDSKDCLSARWEGETDEMELMLYTGRTDANGKPIWQGDKVTSDIIHLFEDRDILNTPAEVIYSEKYAAFALELNGKIRLLSDILIGWNSSVLKVVGNIYEGV